MQLLEHKVPYEMVHMNAPGLFIAHRGEKIRVEKNEERLDICFPDTLSLPLRILMKFRLSRRALRLDKAMICYVDEKLLLFRHGSIYRYEFNTRVWTRAQQKMNCRNPMYNAILCHDGNVYIGEYGRPGGEGKRILKSCDGGLTWQTVYQFKADEIRHIHCLAWDPYEQKIWVFTGDADGQCQVLCASVDFSSIELIGDGTQVFRACHVFFYPDRVEWIMDSPLAPVRHVRLERVSRSVILLDSFPGPVWFAQSFPDGSCVAATADENGLSQRDRKLRLYLKRCGHDSWIEARVYHNDMLPKKLFRCSTITFAHGNASLNDFCASFEGVRGLDGKSVRYSLQS